MICKFDEVLTTYSNRSSLDTSKHLQRHWAHSTELIQPFLRAHVNTYMANYFIFGAKQNGHYVHIGYSAIDNHRPLTRAYNENKGCTLWCIEEMYDVTKVKVMAITDYYRRLNGLPDKGSSPRISTPINPHPRIIDFKPTSQSVKQYLDRREKAKVRRAMARFADSHTDGDRNGWWSWETKSIVLTQ